jgi:hypothetical protein
MLVAMTNSNLRRVRAHLDAIAESPTQPGGERSQPVMLQRMKKLTIKPQP